MEPMEETVYLDQLRLLAVDHPAAYEVFPNERFVSAPPFPDFRVIASNDAHPPVGAWDDRGNDVLSLISKRDRKYVTDFEGLPFTGFAKLHWIELELGRWDAAKPLRLIIDGYTDYFTATSMYAADQAGIKVIAPYVEALDAHNKWVRVLEDMGFPAGLERTMVTDLTDKLPAGTRRIRIVSNLKIYWDAIRIDQTPDAREIHTAEVPPPKLRSNFGYPRDLALLPASDTVYSFTNRSIRFLEGAREGNYISATATCSIVCAVDDRFVVSVPARASSWISIRPMPALPAGWVRDYFFYANGFEKIRFPLRYGFSRTLAPLDDSVSISRGQAYPDDAQHLGMNSNTIRASGRIVCCPA
jgi:hypothetical protein